MFTSIKSAICKATIFSILALPAFMAPMDAEARKVTVADLIPTTGKTVDQKYYTYDLQGELDDINYMSGDTVYQPQDLKGLMPFIQRTDVNRNGYQCQIVCKDRQGHVVGLNPNVKWLQ